MTDATAKAKANATAISAFKKLSHLMALSEDDFRDKVVRPLFLKKGLRDGRELCGPDEEGKDSLFVENGKIKDIFHAVQTKKGALNMSREPKLNVAEAIAQLRLSLEVQYPLIAEHRKIRPDYVILCVSGKANTAARKHIIDTLKDSRVLVYDANDLIPQIDEHYPEYWYGIDADKFPYYTNFKQELAAVSDVILFEGGSSEPVSAVAERYVATYVYRYEKEVKRSHGRTYSEAKKDKIPVAGILKRKETLVAVVGDGGAGKTTALRRLAYQIVDDAIGLDAAPRIPVLLRAKDVAQDATRLLDLAGEETKRIAKAKNSCFSTDDLSEGRVILLIDALDEVTAEIGRRLVLDKIETFSISHPKCYVVLTSRTEAFSNEADSIKRFARYEVSSLSAEQVEQLVTKLVHVRSLPSETAQETLRKLKDVHGVTMNPLLVTIFVATSDYSRQDVPANITEVFKKYTEMMLGRWDQTKGFAQQYQYKLKDHLLQRFAVALHRSKSVSLPVNHVRALIETELTSLGKEDDINSVFHELTDRSCLLRITEGSVEFRHMLFQEFFAGRALRDRTELREIIHDRWWKNAAVFYFGENPSNQHEINSLITELNLSSPAELYCAAIALGLSTQACYLSKVADRVNSLKWVAESLGSSMEGAVDLLFKAGDNPILSFILYFLHAKEAVATNLIGRVLPNVGEDEAARFWCLVGLIESGELEAAYNEIRHYRPSEQRYLLAIALACFATEGLRITTSANRGFATKIRGMLDPKVKHLVAELSKEFDSLLLEVQKGQIKAIGDSKARPAAPSESHDSDVEKQAE